MRKDRYREGYVRALEGKRVEGDGDNVEYIWEQVKRAMVESAREACALLRMEGENPKSVSWSDEVKAAVMRNEAA